MKTWHLVVIGVGVIVLAAVVLARVLVFQPYRVPSGSMHPTIPEGSYLMVNKLGYTRLTSWGVEHDTTTARIERGDIVVFVPQVSQSTYVSRIVAVPGDHIEYRNRQMTLNGEAVPVVMDPTPDADGYQLATEQLGARKIRIAFMRDRQGRDFVLDVPENEYVVFGDSRDNARDSRYLGTIPKDRIVGRVVRILNFGL